MLVPFVETLDDDDCLVDVRQGDNSSCVECYGCHKMKILECEEGYIGIGYYNCSTENGVVGIVGIVAQQMLAAR